MVYLMIDLLSRLNNVDRSSLTPFFHAKASSKSEKRFGGAWPRGGKRAGAGQNFRGIKKQGSSRICTFI
jgi:hypothetical protein